jgi:class 3 adenylate cyclase
LHQKCWISLAQFNEDSNTSWQIRIGIASGSCIAGIVGTKKVSVRFVWRHGEHGGKDGGLFFARAD